MLKYRFKILGLIVLLTSFLILKVSCSLILSKSLGIKQSRVESFEEQSTYLMKNSLSTEHLYVFNPIYKDSLKLPTFYIAYTDSIGFSPIQFRMYGSNGKLVSGWASCFGKADEIDLYKEFPPKFLPWLNSSLTFQSDINLLLDENGKKINSEEILRKYDYVIIAFWAEYLGKLSKNMLVDLENYINKYNDKNVILLKVNLGNPDEQKRKS